MTVLTHNLALPGHYQRAELLAFHQRDAQQFAEQVNETTLAKGMLWDNTPARLRIDFQHDQAQAQLQIDSLQTVTSEQLQDWRLWLEYFLGLQQPITEFLQAHQTHPELGPLLSRQAGLRVAQTSSPFEAVSWAIIGQQISVAAALNIRRRFIELAGAQHSSGIWCYPNAQRVAQLSIEQLRSAGLSQNKARAIAQMSQQLASGQMRWPQQLTDDNLGQLRTALLAIPGIGPWTVNYTLMRGFAWLDGSLHGDAAVRRYLQELLQAEQLTAQQTEQWLAQFSPWRALVAAHLWQSQGFSG